MFDFSVDIQSPSFISPVIVLVTSLSFLKIFIREQGVLEKDINLILSKLKEKTCVSYNSLLKASVDSDAFIPLRGDSKNQPDLINDHVNILFKNIKKTFELRKLLYKTKFIYTFLMLSRVIPLIVLFAVSVIQNIIDFNMYIEMSITSFMAILFVGLIYEIFYLKRIEEKIKSFEE